MGHGGVPCALSSLSIMEDVSDRLVGFTQVIVRLLSHADGMDPGWVLIHLLVILWSCCCFNRWLLWQKLVFGATVVVDSGADFQTCAAAVCGFVADDTVIQYPNCVLRYRFMIFEGAER
jgi:hypothetical protein